MRRAAVHMVAMAVLSFVLVSEAMANSSASFIAYSLDRAEELKRRGESSGRLDNLGGITRLAGMVYDGEHDDLILVGLADDSRPTLSLDDLAVALRSVHVHQTPPLVSIDRTPESSRTRTQTVRMEGGIADTQFGADLLAADLVLKRLALGDLPTSIWGFESYFDYSADRAQAGETDVRARFWFHTPKDNILAVRANVMAIQRVAVRARTEVFEGQVLDRDPAGDMFVEGLNSHHADICAAYPAVGKLKPLFELVALSQGIEYLDSQPNIDYWLRRHQIEAPRTARTQPLLSREVEIGYGSRKKIMSIDGGIELKALILRLKDGDVTAMRDLVLQSRTGPGELSWRVPMDEWRIPGTEELDFAAEFSSGTSRADVAALSRKIGVSIDRVFRSASPGAGTSVPTWTPTPLPSLRSADSFSARTTGYLDPMRNVRDIGGVMLAGRMINGGGVDLSSGSFSMVVEGQNATLSPDSFRKFVTALWAVYFDDQAPGISIDPIGQGVDKHVVRYIGSVLNSDLGRVMRDADYAMKKWAVGTERPNIPGFECVDELSRNRAVAAGTSRRFWFVPEDMRFRRGDNSLLFADGAMTLKTEYLSGGARGTAAPPDAAFARFFTEHYEEIAEKYPVFDELHEYSKLVAIARYLKEQQVPMFWFLMANKDLVLTEDAIGVVDELVKESEHRRGVTIHGGVDLGAASHYVTDEATQAAVRQALAHRARSVQSSGRTQKRRAKTVVPEANFEFEVGSSSYSVVPQHTLTSGRDRRGVRYQTDVALQKDDGPSLELVRYFAGDGRGGAFGDGWDLLIPYRVKPESDATREFANAMVPEKMLVENIVTGDTELLTFDTERYTAAGYVPRELGESQLAGLFIMSDASFRLVDKLGNEFWFDGAGRMNAMRFGSDYHVDLEYVTNDISFKDPPYRVRRIGDDDVEFRGVILPRRMELVDLTTGWSEILTFSQGGRLVGYVSDAAGNRSRTEILALLSDGSFQLLDRSGNEFRFDGGGHFEKIVTVGNKELLHSITHGEHQIEFAYGVGGSGAIVIRRAKVLDTKSRMSLAGVDYDYDSAGLLANVVHERGFFAR